MSKDEEMGKNERNNVPEGSVTPRNTPESFLNIIRVYYKCILKFFAIIILLSEKILKLGICTRYKGKNVQIKRLVSFK